MTVRTHIEILRKVVVFLVLLSAPIAQARVFDICTMMGGEVASEDCCCGSAHDRMGDRPTPDACCMVSIEFGGQHLAGAALGQFERSAPHDHGGDTPVFASDSLASRVAPAGLHAPLDAIHGALDRANARSLYLTTARLRL